MPSAESERHAAFRRRKREGVGGDGWTPVRYVYGTWGREELLAWYAAADAAVVTPARDGMNLVAKEFVAAKHGRGGTLVLSEFAGCAVEFPEAVLTNPFSARAMDAALDQAEQRRGSGDAQRHAGHQCAGERERKRGDETGTHSTASWLKRQEGCYTCLVVERRVLTVSAPAARAAPAG